MGKSYFDWSFLCFLRLCLHFMNHLILFCNESRGKDDKSTVTIVSNAADEQISQTRAAEKSSMRQESAIYFDIQN